MKFGVSKEKITRNLPKDIIVTACCFAFFIALIAFMFTPWGASFFDTLRTWLPFGDLIEGTLSDVHRALGLTSELFRRGTLTDAATEANGIGMTTIFFDLSKMLLAIILQNLLLLLFTKLFLYGGKKVTIFNPVTGQDEEHFLSNILSEGFEGSTKDIYYCLNHTLLFAISVLLGGFAAAALVYTFSQAISSYSLSEQFWYALGAFGVMLLISVVYFIIKTRCFLKITLSFTRTLTRIISKDITGGIMTLLITNVAVVFLFHSAVCYGFAWITFLALGLFILWLFVEKLISGLFEKLHVKDLPYCGKYCPFTGLLWFPATLSFLMIFYLAASMYIDANVGEKSVEWLFGHLPLLQTWGSGMSVLDAVTYAAPLLSDELINLLILCTVAAVFQYVSSSFTGTLFTQIVIRFLILMGTGFVILFFAHMILYWACPPLLEAIGFANLVAFVLVMLYLLFFSWQPHIAVQGILTAAGTVLVMEFLPVSYFSVSEYATMNELSSFLTVSITLLIINLVLSLIQNIVAVFEKKANLAKKALETTTSLISK